MPSHPLVRASCLHSAALMGRGQVSNLPLTVVPMSVIYSLETGGSMPRLVYGLR